ncbi:hypothetical protein ACHAW5_004611 [Stephanodiscus triporus]|uniref:Uncharacterized protein n=1 Tax=Stephanodiscus triporus TaxID=2934178 RepID=A0ABD3QZX8_9STRA
MVHLIQVFETMELSPKKMDKFSLVARPALKRASTTSVTSDNHLDTSLILSEKSGDKIWVKCLRGNVRNGSCWFSGGGRTRRNLLPSGSMSKTASAVPFDRLR